MSIKCFATFRPTMTLSAASALTFATAVFVDSDLVIKGITLSGQQFRPSDWSDRLCGVMSAFGADEQLRYSPLYRPMRCPQP